MADNKSSWRRRRWEIFLRVYRTNAEFRKDLEKISHRLLPVGEAKRIHYQILSRYDVPASCSLAILLYLSNSNLDKDEYLKLIIPPVRFLNSTSNVLGPQVLDVPKDKSAYRPDNATDFIYEQIGKPLRDKLKLSYNDVNELTKRITSGLTFLIVSPYTQKSELIGFINEYWDEISKLVNTPGIEVNDLPPSTQKQLEKLQTKKLANKVFDTETQKNWNRGERVIELTEQGLNDTQITTKLGEEGFGKRYTEAHIRQIRYRHKRKKDVT